MILINKEINIEEIIKTIRIFEKNNKIHLDYRVNEKYIINGKERCRFSLGIDITKQNLEKVEKDIYSLALNHYLKSNGLKNPNEISLKDIAMDALNEDKDNRSEDTHQDYVKIYESSIFPIFGDMLLNDIKARHIKIWKSNILNDKNLSKSRFNKYYRTLNFIFKYLYVNELIDKNPMDFVDKKSKVFKDNSTQTAMKYYSKEEIQKILQNAEGWFKVLITTLFYTGMRTGESIALKWSDIDFQNNKIIIQRNSRHGKVKNTTKTGIINVIDMAEPVREILLQYRDIAPNSDWIFPNQKTLKPYWDSKSIIKYYLKPLLKKLGIEYKTLYATRHSFASIMVENNIPLTYVQKQLGHKRLSTTMDFYVKNGLINQNRKDIRIDKLYS